MISDVKRLFAITYNKNNNIKMLFRQDFFITLSNIIN